MNVDVDENVCLRDCVFVTRDGSQRRFLTQQDFAMLKQCCDHTRQHCNVLMLCCAKNRRCVSPRVPSPLKLR